VNLLGRLDADGGRGESYGGMPDTRADKQRYRSARDNDPLGVAEPFFRFQCGLLSSDTVAQDR
jgi:hypothetical protein